MSKDPFQELTSEMTAFRRSVEHLERTSLSKQEAKDLNATVAKAVAQMERAAKQAPANLEAMLREDRTRIVSEVVKATAEATGRSLKDIHHQLGQERLHFAKAAGEARREAWRYFGGFWAWAAALLATGAFLGALTIYGMETAKSLFTVDQMVRYGCGRPFVGGQVVERDDGSSYCATWIVDPDTAKWRRERDQGS